MSAVDSSKIHHWCPCSQLGGVEMALLAFIQGAPEMRHTIFTADGRGAAAARWREAGAEVVVVDGWSRLLGLSWFKHWRMICLRRHISRIIIWTPSRLALVLSALSADTKALVHIGTAGRSDWKIRLFHGLACLLLPQRVRPVLVACSVTVRQVLSAHACWSAYANMHIPNAIQPAYLQSPAARPAPGGGHWGMVARLDALKDHATLLRAVPLVARRHPEFRLTLVGDGLLRPALEASIRELGVGDKVMLAGTIARPWELMSGWGGAVFSTGPQEGFGIAAAEAMAMGLPCVFTDLPVMREVGGDAVLYARPGSAESLAEQIDALITDTALAARLGQAAALRARECFSPPAFAAAYLRAFELSA
jgi:glycosyltransferase involved in cell wall biosynthesis